MTQNLVAVAGGGPAGSIPFVMHDADDVDQPSALDRIVHEMRVVAEPQMHQRLAERGRHGVGRRQRAPGGATGKARRALAADLRAQGRPDAIGADQDDAAFVDHLPALAALHGDAVVVGGIILDLGAEPQRDVALRPRGIGEHRLQVAAVESPVGRAVAPLGVGAERNAHDLAAGAAGHHPDRLRGHDMRREGVAQAERDEHAAGIGRQLQAGAGLFQLFRLFQDRDAQAPAHHGQCRGQPADAGTDDHDMASRRLGGLTLTLNQGCAWHEAGPLGVI